MDQNDHITPTLFDFDDFVKAKLNALKSKGSYRQFLLIDKQASLFPKFSYRNIDGKTKQATNWCTNDYLALSTWQGNRDKANEITHLSGTGSGGTRNISGSTIYHQALEGTLALWHDQERAILFNSAYQANLTTLATLGRHIPELIFISDEENHASLIEGMRSTANKKLIFRHNDIDHLECILNKLDAHAPKIIVFESIYSISGTIAPVAKIVELAKKHHCLTFVDEVHAVGLYGNNGSGLLNQLGLSSAVDIINGTLSKAIGVFGGYIAASHLWIDFIRSFGSGFIFTTSLPPALCAAAEHSIREIIANEELRKHFFENVTWLRHALDDQYIRYSGEGTHITNIHIGDAERCKAIATDLLEDHGQYLQPINHPTVPEGKECLRITVTPRHTRLDMQDLARSLNRVLKPKIILTGRSSRLSKVQMRLAHDKIKVHFPDLHEEVQYKESRGDRLAHVALHTQEGIDFFTEDVFNELKEGSADIAIHSLKDMSSAHFFGEHRFAVIDRDEVRDIAIFNPEVLDKIKSGKPIQIGTCSFRREYMAFHVLKNILPQLGPEITIEPLPIRGNIDTRLNKLNRREYDGIILAAAGINRMLNSIEDRASFLELMANKKWMVLPLVECVPAPCQAAIVVEAIPTNRIAQIILNKIKDPALHLLCMEEKRIANHYGAGCIQKFGVTTLHIGDRTVVLAKGQDESGVTFEDWHGLNSPGVEVHPDFILSSDELGYVPVKSPLNENIKSIQFDLGCFIAHISAIDSISPDYFHKTRVWVAGMATWKKMAQKGIWVEGCADSFGFQSIASLLKTSLISLDPLEISILTNKKSALRWIHSGYRAIGTYELTYESNLLHKYKLISAKMIFWNCFAHYDSVQNILPSGIIHACLPGRTAEALKIVGLDPLIFPTINAFNQWKKKYIQAYIAA